MPRARAAAAHRVRRAGWLHWLMLVSHRWAGVILGVPIFIVAVTGAALVFDDWVDRALNPELRVVTPRDTRASLDDMTAMVQAAYPNDVMFEIRIHRDPTSAANAYLRRAGGGFLVVFLDQYQGTIKGHRGNLDTPMMWIHRLHTGRFAGEAGAITVAVLTMVALFGVLGGLYLWWPRKIWMVKRGLNWRRTNFDLHSVLGIFSSAALVFTLLTGIVVTFEQPVERFLVRVLDGQELPPPPPRLESTPPEPGQRALSLDEAVARSETALPGTRFIAINIPANDKATYGVLRAYPEDKTGAGRSRVVLDQFSGDVLRATSSRTALWGTRIMNFNETTHVGSVLGWPTIVLAFLGSVALAGQVATGFVIWWKPKRRARTPAGQPSGDPRE